MVFVPVTDRGVGTGNAEPGEGAADGSHARTRHARARERIVDAYTKVTHRDRPRRVVDPYAGALDDPADAPPGWWRAGPDGPAVQAGRYLAWVRAAREQSTPLAVALAVLLLPLYAVGAAASLLAWLTQHLAVLALVVAVAAVLAGGVLADGGIR